MVVGETAMGLVRWPVPSLEEQRTVVEQHKLETLLYCPHPWALRHRFVHVVTGDMVRVRCNRWNCLYCGPRKVDQWRQLVKAAEPTLFLTLSKAGTTVEEAARALTTFMQALRRGSKGLGRGRVGARLAYPVEYFAVLERHKNFEENGFHWHLLLRGVAHIPYKEVIQPLWRSARHGKAEIGHIEGIRKPAAIGYVTKYLTKDVTRNERGVRQVEYVRSVATLDAQEQRTMVSKQDEQGALIDVEQAYVYMVRVDEQGRIVEHQETVTIEAVSRAHRIRYSRNFFPERVADLRLRLFTSAEKDAEGRAENGKPVEGVECEIDGDNGNGKPVESTPDPQKRSQWRLVEKEEFTNNPEQYQLWRREALNDALEDVRSGDMVFSRRVLSVWAYQRSQLRHA